MSVAVKMKHMSQDTRMAMMIWVERHHVKTQTHSPPTGADDNLCVY